MHLFHTPQYFDQNKNVQISVLNGALWDMEQVHFWICEIGLFVPLAFTILSQGPLSIMEVHRISIHESLWLINLIDKTFFLLLMLPAYKVSDKKVMKLYLYLDHVKDRLSPTGLTKYSLYWTNFVQQYYIHKEQY